MATPTLGRAPTCLNCLRRISHTASTTPLSLTQFRSRSQLTKAQLEDLQGIPVRLLRDTPTFGRQDAIIRVKPGRMRNIWFPKGIAEYMTQDRMKELGLTEAAIGVRDRNFGVRMPGGEYEEDSASALDKAGRRDQPKKKRETLALPAEQTRALLVNLLPEVLTFRRKPIATPGAKDETVVSMEQKQDAPQVKRSPSLRANSKVSDPELELPTPAADTTAFKPAEPAPTAIFGSVSTSDVLGAVKEALLVDEFGSRVAIEAENLVFLGLEEGEDRIKRLGRFEVEIKAGKDAEPVKRVVEVVAEE